MSVALRDTIGPRATRLSVLVSEAEAAEVARRAAAAELSVSAYLRAQALGAPAPPEERQALAVFDRVLDELVGRVDAANQALGAALARLG